jgi:PAS domain S-box-containing protein
MRNLILRLGLIKTTLLLTAVSIPFSVFLYVFLSSVWGGIIVRDIAISAIIPSIVAPCLLYFSLRNIIRLDRSKEAQRESQEKYSALFNRDLLCVYIHDFEGRFLDVNEACLHLLGYTAEEFLSLKFAELIGEDQFPEAIEAFEEIIRVGSAKHYNTFKIKKKDGNFVWVETEGSLIYKKGKPYAILGVARDITHHRIAEEALKESEEKYKELANSLPQIVFETDENGMLTFVNQNAFDLFGYTQTDLANGLNALNMLVPQDRDRALENIGKVLKGEKVGSVEYISQRIDGRKFPIVIYANRILREDKSVGLRGIIIDLTEQKRSEKLLRESEVRFRTALEANPDPVVIYDVEGNVSFFNHAFSEVFGWTVKECKGKKMDMFVPEKNWPETKKMIETVMAGKNVCATETCRYTKNGKIIPVVISGSIFYNRDGKAEGSVINLRDIREQKRLQAQLQMVQKIEAIGTLAGGIAHDFNNLLMAIQGNVSLMLLDTDVSDPHYAALMSIEDRIQSGSNLTGQLLGYARKGKYEVNPINPNQFIEETSETFGRMRKDISIHKIFSSDLYEILADRGQMEQVLLNLFVNAADAMPAGGKLSLTSENVTHADMKNGVYNPKPGIYVKLTVADTGTGMDKKIQERIFDPFFTTKEKGRGTGLGLASVYGIIKNHGGYITVESEKERGAVFNIYLPAIREKHPREKEPHNLIVSGSGTILLVDDEEMVLEVNVKVLEKLGYSVLEAKSGKEAISAYRENKDEIDMVILDMVMPGMGGGEVYDIMKEINTDVKVLLSSGHSLDGQAQKILQRGCDGFLPKPYRMGEVSGKLREILSA